MPYIIPTAGVIILIACTGLLLAPLFRWRFKYDANLTPVTMDIPRAGRYCFFIRHNRSWSFNSRKRRLSFAVAVFDARNNNNDLVSAHKMSVTPGSGAGIDTVRVGYFNAPYPGKYTIVNLPESQFNEKDKVIIQKHVGRIRQSVLILGILISPHMFTSGLAGGLVSIGGFVFGVVLIGLNSW